jgi:hypothetical protein
MRVFDDFLFFTLEPDSDGFVLAASDGQSIGQSEHGSCVGVAFQNFFLLSGLSVPHDSSAVP